LYAAFVLSAFNSTVKAPAVMRFWRHSQTGRKVTIPHHTGDLAEGTLRAILREAGIDVQSFLKA
jgi:HicA toxin of bacterial toxin-antitoxin,